MLDFKGRDHMLQGCACEDVHTVASEVFNFISYIKENSNSLLREELFSLLNEIERSTLGEGSKGFALFYVYGKIKISFVKEVASEEEELTFWWRQLSNPMGVEVLLTRKILDRDMLLKVLKNNYSSKKKYVSSDMMALILTMYSYTLEEVKEIFMRCCMSC